MTQRPVVSLRMDEKAVHELDRMAKAAGVSRSAMAERLVAEGLEDPDVTQVREEVREARRAALEIRTRLMAALGREVDKITKELK
jgi:metal-responsive CopG/Arc/MetJ family transcriptional regulator